MIRQAIGAIVVKDTNNYLLVEKRAINTTSGMEKIESEWDIVKGGVEVEDASLEGAVLRELEEETGSADYSILHRFDEKISFQFPKEIASKIGFERQETVMFLVEFAGKESELIAKDFEICNLIFVEKDSVVDTLTHKETINFFEKHV